MKKRILSLILALSMVLSVLPLGAFAADPLPELVMGATGYPVCSNGTKGDGWEYSGGILTLTNGSYDFNYFNPKTHGGGSTEQTVHCGIKLEQNATITGGTFDGEVTNKGTIENGTFNEKVINGRMISNGIFKGTVTNGFIGTISGGTFAGSVENQGTVTGGVFKRNATLTDVTGLHSITWDAASSKANIVAVNDVAANWAPYAYKGTTVTIIASTEIYSLNGKLLTTNDRVNGDKKTVKFTMPDKDVVLSTGELVMENGYPVGSSGKGWRYISGTLYLDEGTYNFSSTHPQTPNATGARPVPAVKCAIESYATTTITGGTFTGGSDGKVTNYGTISGGNFKNTCSVTNGGTIKDNGTFNGTVTNNFLGTISDGTFTGTVENSGTISGGTFQDGCSVTNKGTIKDNGTFEGTVTNSGTIENGTFAYKVENNGSGAIFGGTFKGTVTNNAKIYGGVFNGKTGLDGVTGLHSIAVASGAKIEKVNDVSVGASENWDPYVVVTASTKDQEVTITANTEIYSLNGRVLSTNDRVNGDKTTVKFTMPDEDVVLGTGELVMENGYPVGSDDGTADCKGNGWKYTKGDTSNPKGKLTLKKSGKYDFSYTYPQNTSKGAGAEPVACAVETQWDVEITGGTFEGEVINNHLGEISGGTFHEKVSNYNGMISGGTFKSSVTSTDNGRIYGGVFNSKTTQKPATDAYSITLDAAYPNAKITEVNGVPAEWEPYVVVTEWTMNQKVIITASTEIFSLNGKSIGDGNCKSSYDGNKNTVKFTMPGEPVVLNRTAELKVVDGEIKNGETAKGSGRVLIGGKVEVTTKDKTKDFVGWTIAPEGIELRHDDGSAVDLTSERTFSFMMPDVSGGKLTLTANYQPFRTSLLMNADGTVNLEHVDSETYDGNEICKGDGWNVFNRGTLILEKGTYDFRYTAPTEKTGTLEAVTCGVQNKGGTIENGVFRNLVLNEVGGTITGGTFAVGLFEMPGMTSGTVTGGVFNGKTGLTNAHHVTVTDGSLLKVNGEDPLKVDETTGAVTTGTAWDLYSYAGTTVTITADTEIFSLNGQPIAESSYGSDKTTVTFTMPDDDVVLNKAITSTDLVMENGYPKDSNGGKNPCKGDGWEYIKNDPTNGDMLLLTDGLFDFSTIGDGLAVECNVFVGKPTAITGGEFNGKVFNNSGILGGTFHGEVDNMGPGRIVNGTFKNSVENNGMIENGTFHDEVKNNGTINGGVFNGAVTGSGTVSESITGSGTLNGELITKTPQPEPEPEPTTYTVTVIGGTIDGKTSVSAKENDTLTVVLDQNDIPDGMTFDMWSISSSKLSGDINVDYRAEAMTFPMPPEDVTIRAQYRSAEIIEDAAPSPLATAATIAVGGAAAGIVVWQGVSLGVDLYLANALPQGVPVPTDRRALALLLWETAGKPEVALPTLYGDIPAEEIELQKATRWAVQNGLMDAADKKDASFFDPDHYVTKMDVFGAWLRLKKLLGTIGTSPTQ